MSEFTAELFGTFLLILLGGSVNANVKLKQTTGHGSDWILTNIGWGAAVAIAIYSVVAYSGAHLNPAVTLGMASIGELEPQKIGSYIAGQFCGAILGAIAVWLAFLPHWEATEDTHAKLGVFSTGPAIDRPLSNLVTEGIGTFALVFGVLAIFSPEALTQAQDDLGGAENAESLQQEWAYGIKPLLVGLLVLVIGMDWAAPPVMPSIQPASGSAYCSRIAAHCWKRRLELVLCLDIRPRPDHWWITSPLLTRQSG